MDIFKVVLETYHEGSDRCDGGPQLTSQNDSQRPIARVSIPGYCTLRSQRAVEASSQGTAVSYRY